MSRFVINIRFSLSKPVAFGSALQSAVTSVRLMRIPALRRLAMASSFFFLSGPVYAQSGTWTNPLGGSWNDPTNWNASVVASGTDSTADFSTLTLTAVPALTLDGARTIGHLVFGDLGNTYGWTLNTGGGGPLTLAVASGSPTITVSGQTTAIPAALAGNQGFTESGGGVLTLGSNNTYTGTTIINGGTVEVTGLSGALGQSSNNPVQLNGGTIEALFASTATTYVEYWPINVGPSGGNLNLLQVGNTGRWQCGTNTLTGSGTLHLVCPSTRFVLGDQSASGFSGKWIIDGANRSPTFNSGYVILGPTGDSSFGAEPATFTPAAIVLTNNGGIEFNNLSQHLGSPTRGITITNGGGNLVIGVTGAVQIDALISGTTGDPLYITGNGAGLGVQMNQSSNTYNGDTVIYTISATGLTFLRLGTNEVVPDGPGKGLVDFQGPSATLDLNGYNETINGFGASAPDSGVDIMSGSGVSTFTAGNADISSSFAGMIKNSQGTLSVVKIGAGTVAFNGTDTYAGSTTVSNGELDVTAGLQQGGGDYAVEDGSTLSITPSATSLPMSSFTLGGTSGATVSFNLAGSLFTTVPVVTASSLTVNAATINLVVAGGVALGQYPLIGYSGAMGGAGFGALHLVTPLGLTATLVNDVIDSSIDVNITGAPTSDGAPFALNDSITLCSANSYSGYFDTISLPPLGGGLAWSTANLAVNGTIQVVSVSTTIPTLGLAFQNGTLDLSWPADHTGWRLLVQTNNLADGISRDMNDCGTVANSALTNQVAIQVNGAQPAEFYQLVYS